MKKCLWTTFTWWLLVFSSIAAAVGLVVGDWVKEDSSGGGVNMFNVHTKYGFMLRGTYVFWFKEGNGGVYMTYKKNRNPGDPLCASFASCWSPVGKPIKADANGDPVDENGYPINEYYNPGGFGYIPGGSLDGTYIPTSYSSGGCTYTCNPVVTVYEYSGESSIY